MLMAGSYWAMRKVLPVVSDRMFIESFISSGEEERSYPLHEAAAEGDVETLRSLLAKRPDINARDDFWYTPLMSAAENGETAAVKLLLEAGADVHLTDKNTSPGYDPIAMMEEFDSSIAALSEASKQQMRDLWKSMPGDSAMNKATNGEIVQLLTGAGGNPSEVNDETRALILGLQTEGDIACTPEEYKAGKSPRYGKANPEKMNVAFWNAMTRSGVNAYSAREKFNDTALRSSSIVWCNQRFGKSLTSLPDGRSIEIGGEHEDFSDHDFFIYNDVFVHHGKGNFEIFGYPETVFPPTDFHSATLVRSHIYIIGGLGYPQDRKPGTTPVYRLNTRTLAMEKVKTSGQNPGWIQRHRANFKAIPGKPGEIHLHGGSICMKNPGMADEEWVDNAATFVLDLKSMEWRRASIDKD